MREFAGKGEGWEKREVATGKGRSEGKKAG